MCLQGYGAPLARPGWRGLPAGRKPSTTRARRDEPGGLWDLETLPSQADLWEFARTRGGTVFHPTGTCRMGSDAGSVVDPELRVRGVSNLRVIDASVMPSITSANTNAATFMIAEKGAELVLQAAGPAAAA